MEMRKATEVSAMINGTMAPLYQVWIKSEKIITSSRLEDITFNRSEDEEDKDIFDFEYNVFDHVVFNNCSFKNCYLKYAVFLGCLFCNCNFEGSEIDGCSFFNVDFHSCNFLKTAFWAGNTFFNCNCKECIMALAHFSNKIKSCDIKINNCINFKEKCMPHVSMACPTEGGFIGWKKAYKYNNELGTFESVLVKLLIPASAQRSSAYGKKCRCDKAKVLSITGLKNEEEYKIAYSMYDTSFEYRVGEYVEPKFHFCPDRFNECASGIHFFIDKQDAINY